MSLKNGYLKRYFKGIVAKRLSDVETSSEASNQHEFNATTKMREIFGMEDRKFKADFLYIDDYHSLTAHDSMTWYDARRNHLTRTEYRLYYPSSVVSDAAVTGDSLFICLKQDETVLCIISKKDASITSQLYWLFDIFPNEKGFTQNVELATDSYQLEFVVRTILTQIGIEYVEEDDNYLPLLLDKFGNAFPKTSVFSDFARSLVLNVDPIVEPDITLMRWFDMEEKLFYVFEQHSISERLKEGFYDYEKVDVNGFVQFSLSVQNRRKSRAGLSLENHIRALLDANGLEYSHTPVTENHSKPDFIFPNISCYQDNMFPSNNLIMLGVKSTCKDRWRQVLSEADRIHRKHLLTLEAAISSYQTDEMASHDLQLVIPSSIHKTYTLKQQSWLYSVADFIKEVRENQELTKMYVYI